MICSRHMIGRITSVVCSASAVRRIGKVLSRLRMILAATYVIARFPPRTKIIEDPSLELIESDTRK